MSQLNALTAACFTGVAVGASYEGKWFVVALFAIAAIFSLLYVGGNRYSETRLRLLRRRLEKLHSSYAESGKAGLETSCADVAQELGDVLAGKEVAR